MIAQQIPREQDTEHPTERNRGIPLYLPLLALLAFPAFLITGFGSRLGAWQPVPVYILLCVTLLTIQERIAQNRSIAHRAYALVAGSLLRSLPARSSLRSRSSTSLARH